VWVYYVRKAFRKILLAKQHGLPQKYHRYQNFTTETLEMRGLDILKFPVILVTLPMIAAVWWTLKTSRPLS